MADQRIGVSLQFKADTSQAIKKMNELQSALQAVQKVSNSTLPMNQLSSGINQAKDAAAQLAVQLSNAFNQNTGKLDLSRFNRSLKESGMTLEKYKAALIQAGPQGQQAFGQLAAAVASADTHIIRISERMQKLGQTFANTVRWQISSSALNAITSTLSNAYRYAEDLNASLNDIRIVTGYSAAEMDKFAKKANESAKALSTTTKRYADASLIYFQQGLSDQKVQERTDITIKMANVTGQAVQTVSDQLTAVWNNFDDGSQSLEHYADVMTALGAATASSAEEISEGLNKFAATAETVGLSYEYAASALATVTSVTRESADVVGTAFKTLFARIQDLELGKTLDDGTTMGQYSEALAAVGINIKDVNGEVKDMNTILDEMGAKWNTLNKDTQIALAQNVAGVRQYTQLIALMDNWGTFQENLNTAMTSTGALDEQAKIYAESWEAARDRVTAALEDIYDSLLDDDAFIGILNFFADLLESVGNTIDAMGGLHGVLLMVSTALLNINKNALAASMTTLGTSIKTLTKAGQREQDEIRARSFKEATTMYTEDSTSNELRNTAVRNEIELETTLHELSKDATEQQKQILQYRKDGLLTAIEESKAAIETLETREKEAKQLDVIVGKMQTVKNHQDEVKRIQEMSKQKGAGTYAAENLILAPDFNAVNVEGYLYDDKVDDESLRKAGSAVDEVVSKMQALDFGAEGAEEKLKQLFGDEVYEALRRYYESLVQTQARIKELQQMPLEERQKQQEAAQAKKDDIDNKRKRVSQLNAGGRMTKDSTKQLKTVSDNERAEYKALIKEIEEYDKAQINLAQNSDDVEKAIKSHNKALNDQIESFKKNDDVGEGTIKRMKQSAAAEEALGTETVKTTVAVNQQRTASEQLNQTQMQMQGPVKLAERMTAFASTTMTAAMVLQSFKGLIDIWNNEDTSFGDKILSTMMTLGMIIPLLTTALDKQNISKLFGLTLDKATHTYGVLNTKTKTVETATTWLQKIAQDALNASTLVYLGYMALFVLAIVAVIAIIGAIVNAFEKEKTAVEKATEAHQANEASLQALNEKLKETKQELEDVKTLLDDYANTKNVFDGLIEGSTEWYENLQKQNEIIAELLEKYPELVEMGLIKFGQAGYEIVDFAGTRQYVQGQATVAALQGTVAYTLQDIKTQRSALALWEEAEKDRVNQKKQAEIDKVNKNATSERVGTSAEAAAGGAAIALGLLLAPATGGASLALTAMGGLMSADAIAKGEGIADGAAEQREKIENKYALELNKITEEAIQKRKELEKQVLVQYQHLASTLLSSQQGYAELTSLQREAASTLVAQQLNKYYEAIPNYVTAWNVAVSDDFAETLKKAAGFEGSTGWDASKDMSYNLENSDLGQKIVNDYLLREGYGSIKSYGEGVEWTARYLKLNDDTSISLDSIVSDIFSKAAYEKSNMDDAISYASTASDTILAAITQNFSHLSREQMEAIGTAKGSGDGSEGYSLTEDYKKIVQDEYNKLQLGNDFEGYWADVQAAAGKYNVALSETMRQQADLQKGNSYIAQQAEQYDLDADIIKNYAKSLQAANKEQDMSYEQASKLAVANARLSKGLDSLRKNWKDISTTLNSTYKDSYEWMEAATQASQALSNVFGVEVSTDFIDEFQDKIAIIAAGGDEAIEVFQQLEVEAGKDYIVSLGLDKKYEVDFQDMLDELSAQEIDNPEFTVGFKGTIDPSYIESLNTLLKKGAITADQVNAMFNSIGWDPNITFETVEGDPQVTEQKVFDYDTDTGKFKNDPTSWQKIVTTTSMQVPVIGDVTAAPKSPSSIKTNTTTGGSSSKKEKKSVNKEAERYHEISAELDDLQRKYDRVAKAKDRAFGQKKIDLINEEKKAVKNLIAGQEEYLKQIEKNYIADQQILAKYGASFEDGRITNYDEMVAANVAQYNSAVNKYNKGQLSEENFEKYEKAYEQFLDDISQYEETRTLFMDEKDALTDLNHQLQDLELEEIQVKVDLDISLAEDQIKLLEYQIDNLGNSWDDLQQKMSQFGSKMNAQLAIGQAQEQGIRQILGLGENEELDIQALLGSKDLTEAQIQALREYRDGLWDTNAQLKEMRITIQEELISAFDSWNEKMAEGVETIDHLSSMLQGFRDIIDLVGKENLGVSDELLKAMNQAKLDGSRNALQVAKATLDSNKQALADAQAKLDKARKENRTADIENWEAVVKSLSATVTAGEEELMTRWSESLQSAADVFGEAVDSIMDKFESAMSGISGSFEELQTKFSQRSEERDRYLADYERVYELSKLSRDINKSIDTSDSARAASKLKDIQEEVYALQQSGAEVTRYEVDEMRARYELRLAEIALEDAQNAKSQVRMRRDGEGNWSYVYTADSDQIDQAAQNVDDKMYALKQVQSARIDELEEQLVNLPQEFADAIRAISEDVTLTEEQRKKKIEETTQHFQSRYQWLGEQLHDVLGDADKDFNDTLYSQITDFSSIEQAQRTFVTATGTMVSGLGSAYSNYLGQVNGIMEEAGFATDEFATKAQKAIARITAESTKAAKNVKDIASKGEEGFAGLVEAADTEYKNYEKNTQPYIERNKALAESVTQFINEYAKLKLPLDTTAATNALGEIEGALYDVVDAAKAAAVALSKVNNNGNGPGSKSNAEIKSMQTYFGMATNQRDGIWGNITQSHIARATGIAGITEAQALEIYRNAEKIKAAGISNVKYLENFANITTSSGYLTNAEIASTSYKTLDALIKAYKLFYQGGGGGGTITARETLQYDTGGYTGEWGSDGRVAMLHQKELVLNADDTSKFLSAIEIVRNIAQVIDLRAAAQQSALAAMSTVQVAPTTQTLQQDVTIHAEFPNATSHSEIEEAFDTLLNRAAQFANRKN